MFDSSYRPTINDLNRLFFIEELEAAKPVTGSDRFSGCQGYNTDFLGEFKISWPKATHNGGGDILPIPGSPERRLDYTHFSISMSVSRRMAAFVGVNICGSELIKIPRGRDKWSYDGRIALEEQIGNELYKNSLLDRGHLVRREDPNWGADANIANDQTFHFTNCVPQMGKFNQRTWFSLEDYVLKGARVWQEKITVFSGPVFSTTDREFRNTRIPESFWKVIAFLSDDGLPSSTAYIIGQHSELSELEAAFGRFKTYQCSVRYIEEVTGIDFGELRNFDGFTNSEKIESLPIFREIVSPSSILV